MPSRRAAMMATLLVATWSIAWNVVVHGFLLASQERALEVIARPAAERNLASMLGLTVGISAAFVVALLRCRGNPSVRDGALHGVGFALLAGLLVDANQYLLYPIPPELAAGWFLSALVEYVAAGAIAGAWLGRSRGV